VNHAEHNLQRAVLEWLELVHFEASSVTVHTPNGRNAGSARLAGIWKALGVKAGVPDLLTFWPGVDNTPGLALELKAPGKTAKPSAEQKVWLDHFAGLGWRTACLNDLNEIIALYTSHLGLR